jgi:two-component system phosphate regulon response regulator PhoB
VLNVYTKFIYDLRGFLGMTTKRKKILIIDDEPQVCDFVEDLLSFRFDVLKASEPETGLKHVLELKPELVILDLRLRTHNGLDLCKELRSNEKTKHLPVLFYSGSDDFEAIAEAFDLGADDFISKNVRPRELVARILSKVRRIEERTVEPDLISCGNLTLDTSKLEATVSSKVVPLSVLEFTLLKFFVLNKERVMSRASILEDVWQGSHVSSRTIDTHMVYLRKKLEGFDHSLSTVYGAGYILRSAVSVTHVTAAAASE